jgi:ABC-type glycerol-3-phosphate transport system permease component
VSLARLRTIGLHIATYVPLLVWAGLVLMPLFFLYNNALKTSEQVFLHPWSLPTQLQWTNFAQLFDGGGDSTSFATYLKNSFIVTLASLVAVGFIASMAAYALARFPFPGARFVQVLFILALAMPITALLIPIYTLMNGRVDGCSDFGVFARIVVPVSKGGLASVTIVNAVGIWSELLFAFILLSDPNMQTINVGLLAFKTQYQVQWNLLFAAMALSVTPLLLLYALFQRQITKGMTLGAFR